MQKFFLVSASLMLLATPVTAYAAPKSNPVETAEFRVKVATCKATAKTDGVKTSSPDFYSYMGACLGRVTVRTEVAAIVAK